LVLAKQDLFANAEERRLFYVAITRARKHVYLIGSRFWASAFIDEIEKGGYEVDIVGDDVKALNCPLCKTGRIILRHGKRGEFHSCSNYPYCEYVPKRCPKCHKGFLYEKTTKYNCSDDTCTFSSDICPRCGDGYLVLREGKYGRFYGCSNYPECNYIKQEHGKRQRSIDYIS